MVLWQDQLTSVQAQQMRRAGYRAADTANWMVGRMRAIDTSACPTDFRTAYLRHCQAWQEMVDQLRTERTEIAERALTFVFKVAVTKTPDFSLLHAPEGHKRCAAAIHNTWKEVELAAVTAGARLPQ